MLSTKTCIKCHEVKPRDAFYPCRTTLDKRTDKCKECYQREKQEQSKKNRPLVSGIPGSWAICKKVVCTHPTSKCWLSYQKALCCLDCLGFNMCDLPEKCLNHPDKCKK